MEYYSAIKKNEILSFATTWIELEGIMLSEISQRQISYDFTHMKALRHRTDEPKGSKNNRKTGRGTKHETLKYGEQTEGCWRSCGRGDGLNG